VTTPNYTAGLIAAVAAAVLYGGAPVLQARVAGTAAPAHGVGLGLVWSLLRRPVWLLAFVGEVGGFLVEAYAFSVAPTALVAPIASCDMLVFVAGASLMFRRVPSRVGVAGAVAATAGAVTLAVAAQHARPGDPASGAVLIWLLVGSVVVTAALVAVAGGVQRAAPGAVAVSLAAGVTYGVATLATRQLGLTFRLDSIDRLFTTPAVYVLIVCSVLAIALLQRGLQLGPLIAFPIVSGVSAFVPVVVGFTVLGDQAPGGGLRVLLVVALALIACGLVLMSRDRHAALPTDA